MLLQEQPSAQKSNTPLVTIDGQTDLFSYEGHAFTLPTATAADKQDGEITSITITPNILDESGNVRSGFEGVNTITYSATDSDGNVGTSSISVTVDVPFCGGTGLFGDPFMICTLADLNAVRYYIDTYGLYTLANDIDATDTSSGSSTREWNTASGFLPIDTTAGVIFNGNNKSINGLNINRPETDYIGLFSQISSDDLSISNLSFSDSTIVGKNYTGLLVGRVASSIVNYIDNVDVVSSSITGLDQVGIITGHALDNIRIRETNIDSNSSVAGRRRVGGVLGYASDGVSVTYNESYASIINNEVSQDIGGIVGQAYDAFLLNGNTYSGTITVENGTFSVGGIAGHSAPGPLYSTTFINNNTSTLTLVGCASYAGGISGTITQAEMNGNNANFSFNEPSCSSSSVGGIVGEVFFDIASTSVSNSTISLNVSTNTTGLGGFAGIIVLYENIDFTNISASGSLIGNDYVGSIVGRMKRYDSTENPLSIDGTSVTLLSVGTNSGDPYGAIDP